MKDIDDRKDQGVYSIILITATLTCDSDDELLWIPL